MINPIHSVHKLNFESKRNWVQIHEKPQYVQVWPDLQYNPTLLGNLRDILPHFLGKECDKILGHRKANSDFQIKCSALNNWIIKTRKTVVFFIN